MKKEEFRKLYPINKEQLMRTYERTKNNLKDKKQVDIVANFLKHHSVIEATTEEIAKILRYYEKRIIDGTTALNLAFEWMRAHEIRLKYKKYLITASYSKESMTLAVDDCISRFFIDYNKYIRKFFKEIDEFEISSLFDIFFSRLGGKYRTLQEILEWQADKVPTIIEENKKISTNIITLRSGLSQIIIQDYEDVLSSRNKEQKSKIQKNKATFKDEIRVTGEFEGLLLERMIKTYCISKNKISMKEIDNVIAQFLTSYFKFGVFYEYDNFIDQLIKVFSEDLHSGLSHAFKKKYELNELKGVVTATMEDFRAINKIKVLDGSAWKNDLMKYLKKLLIEFTDNLFEEKKISIRKPKLKPIKQEIKPKEEGPDFRALFDLNLEIEEFREKLEESLVDSDLGFVKKQGIIRSKVQEFRMEKRKQLIKKRF